MVDQVDITLDTTVVQVNEQGLVLREGGWTADYGIVTRSNGDQVFRLQRWFGGVGDLPAENSERVGWYIGPTGLVRDAAGASPLAIVQRVGSGTVTRDHLAADIIRLLTKAPEELDSDGLNLRLILDNGTILSATLVVTRADVASATGGYVEDVTIDNSARQIDVVKRQGDDGQRTDRHSFPELTVEGTPKGPEIFRSAALSTDAHTTQPNWPLTGPYTLAAGAAELGWSLAAGGLTRINYDGRIPPNNQVGYVLESWEGDTISDRVFMPLGPGTFGADSEFSNFAVLSFSNNARVGIRYAGQRNTSMFLAGAYTSGPAGYPANSTIRVYQWVDSAAPNAGAHTDAQVGNLAAARISNLAGIEDTAGVLSWAMGWLTPDFLQADTPARKKAFRDLLDVKDPISSPDEVSYLSPSESLNTKVAEAMHVNDNAGATYTGLDGFGRMLLFVRPSQSGAPAVYGLTQYAVSLDKPGLYAQREIHGLAAAPVEITADWRPHHVRAQLPVTEDAPGGDAAAVTVEALQDAAERRTEAPLSINLQPDADGNVIDTLNTQGFVTLRSYANPTGNYRRNVLYLLMQDSVFPQGPGGSANISGTIQLHLRQTGVRDPQTTTLQATILDTGGPTTEFQTSVLTGGVGQYQGRWDFWITYTDESVTPNRQRFLPETFQPERVNLTRFTAMVKDGALVAGLTESEVNTLIAAYGQPFTVAEKQKLAGIEAGAQANDPPVPQVQTDWNATEGIASIANRPDLTTYAQRNEIILPAYRKLAGTESDFRTQGMLHSGGARQDAEVVFPPWNNVQRAVPPGQAVPQFNNQGSVSVLLMDGSRLTWFPADYYQAALRGRYRLSPRANFIRDFAPTQMEASTSVDRAVTQEFALSSGTGGTLVSEVATLDLQIPNTGGTIWLNFENANDNYYWTSPESQQPRYMEPQQLARIIAEHNQPNQEAATRPATGWTNSTVYSDLGAKRIPVRIAASLDDRLYLRVGFTCHPPNDIDASRDGGAAWSGWVRVQDLKNYPVTSSPYSTGGEVYPIDYRNSRNSDYRVPANALQALAHNRELLRCRVGDDGYLRFWADNNWTVISSILVQTSYIPWP